MVLLLDQAPDPVFAGDSAYVAALAGASQILADEARAAGAYSGKEPFNFAVAVLFPAARPAKAQTVAAFIDMMTSPDYEQRCDPHRTNGCAEHVSIATEEAYSKFKIP